MGLGSEIRDPGINLFRIRDPGSGIPDPGSGVKKAPDPESQMRIHNTG